MDISSSIVKFIKEYDSSNGGNKCMISVSDFLKLPIEIPDPQDTKIFRCYDVNKNLLGEIRPKKGDNLINITFEKER